jgi:hypothetical protein
MTKSENAFFGDDPGLWQYKVDQIGSVRQKGIFFYSALARLARYEPRPDRQRLSLASPRLPSLASLPFPS